MLRCNFYFQYAEFQLHAQIDMQAQLLGIMGASGSGKSTFLKNIVGLLQPQDGFIALNEQLLDDAQSKLHVPMHQRRIGLIFQKACLFPHLNVMQNLRYALRFQNEALGKFSFNEVVDLLQLKTLLKRRSHQLSGGEAQRVSIGRALLSSPDLLLLDEPLTGLDSQLKEQILPFLKDIKAHTQLPMIYVTHHLEELRYLDAQVMYMVNGKIT